MGAMSIWHWVILLVVAALVFGTGRLKNVGRDVGSAIKGFKEGLNDEPLSKESAAAPALDEKKDSGRSA